VTILKGLFLENQTWPAVSAYLLHSKTIIIPIGSIENEGTHLPLGLDIHVAQYLCEIVSEKTCCMVGPCLPLGYSKWFMDFPGTISLEHETLTKVIKEYCQCLYAHGFRNLIFINPHMGNGNAIADVGRDFRRKGALVIMVDIWRSFKKIAEGIEMTKKSELTHAGDIGTSVALAMYPQHVDMPNAREAEIELPVSKNIYPINTTGFSDFKGNNIYTYVSAEEITRSGLIGDPTGASKEKGEVLLEKMVDYLEEVVREIKEVE